jgi:hypothetical protein
MMAAKMAARNANRISIAYRFQVLGHLKAQEKLDSRSVNISASSLVQFSFDRTEETKDGTSKTRQYTDQFGHRTSLLWRTHGVFSDGSVRHGLRG